MADDLLSVRDVSVFYGNFRAIDRVDIAVGAGEIVSIIGANGAGKSTLLKAIIGQADRVEGTIAFDGQNIVGRATRDIVESGIMLVPEGRRLFSSLSVEENLLVGAYGRRDGGPWTLDGVYRLFPVLKERRHSPSTTLSGGQQQMVAIGRSLMSNPRILLCDELSLGLAPIVIRDIYLALADIKTRGTSVVLVEQDLMHAMSVADRAYCFQEGRVSLSGRPSELTRDEIHATYFGI